MKALLFLGLLVSAPAFAARPAIHGATVYQPFMCVHDLSNCSVASPGVIWDMPHNYARDNSALSRSYHLGETWPGRYHPTRLYSTLAGCRSFEDAARSTIGPLPYPVWYFCEPVRLDRKIGVRRAR